MLNDINYQHIGKLAAKSAIILITIVASTIIFLQIMEPYIGGKAIKKLQSQLSVESSIKDYHLSLFKDFPSLSVVLKDVNIHNPDSFAPNSSFIKAGEASIQMNIWDLLHGRYIFNSLELENSSINIEVNKAGNGNWMVFDESNDTTALKMQWNKVTFNQVKLDYLNREADADYEFMIHTGTLSGILKNDRIDLQPDLNLTIKHLKSQENTILKDKRIKLHARTTIDIKNSFYQFNQSVISYGNSDLNFSGTIDQENEKTYYDLRFDNKALNISSIKNFLSPTQLRSIKGYDFKGTTSLRGSYKGVSDGKIIPQLNLTLSSNKLDLRLPNLENKLNNIEIFLTYSLNKYGIDNLKIKSCEGSYRGKRFNGSAAVNNLSMPSIDIDFSGSLPIQLFNKFAPSITFIDGEVDLKKLKILNFKPYSEKERIHDLSGSFALKDIKMQYEKRKFALPHASGELQSDDLLIVDTSQFLYGASDIKLHGSLRNFMMSIFNARDKSIAFDMKLNSDHIDFKELHDLYETVITPTVKNVSLEENNNESLFAEATGKFRAEIGSFSYNKIKGEAFVGDVFLLKNNYKINGQLLSCNGGMKLTGELDRKNKMNFNGNFAMQEVSIKELFSQWGNFGQTFIESQHLNGKITGKTRVDLQWTKNGAFIPEEMDVISSISINRGELKNFELLESFSTYVDIEDLKNIQFKNLRNILIIRDGNVYIPAMFIQSNAMNLTVNGIHTFDQRIDYNIKVNGGQVLMNKFSAQEDIIPAKRNGWFNLYYTVTGDLNSEYDYRRDKKKVLSSFWQSVDMRERNEAQLRKHYPELDPISEPNHWKDADKFQSKSAENIEIIEGF